MARVLVELRGIVKTFPGVVANAGIDLDILSGQVLALLGENGAGKSTLMSILAGLYRADEGTILIDGRPAEPRSPRDAIRRGVGMVHQHFRLVDNFTVAENVLLGWQEPRFLLAPRTGASTVERLARAHDLAVDPLARIGQLSVGERQRVEILKMLYRHARVLVLDEPTAVLTPQEVERLFAAIRRIVREGCAVVFISHKLDEVLAIADRIVVLRHGTVVGEATPATATPRVLARLMVGHETDLRSDVRPDPGETVLTAERVSAIGDRGHLALREVTVCLRRREIVGIAGVAGNGQRELLEVIVGLRPPAVGRVVLRGRDITRLSPRERCGRGVLYIPEDRLGEGLVAPFDVTENGVLRGYREPPVARGPFLHWGSALALAQAIVEAFEVRVASMTIPVRHLSGGNQQRLLVGREASRRPEVLLAMHPTRGLDVEAAAAMHRVLLDLRAAGTAILLVSESLDELFALADRLAVMHRGRVTGDRSTAEVRREEIGLMMSGGQAA